VRQAGSRTKKSWAPESFEAPLPAGKKRLREAFARAREAHSARPHGAQIESATVQPYHHRQAGHVGVHGSRSAVRGKGYVVAGQDAVHDSVLPCPKAG